MKVTYLDLATGQIATDSGINEFELTENNWSCDCNRAIPFGGLNDSGVCDGCKRYIVVGVESEPGDGLFDPSEVIMLANSEYFMKLISD